MSDGHLPPMASWKPFGDQMPGPVRQHPFEKPTLTTMEPQTYNYFVYVGLMVLGLAVLGFLTSIICTVYQSRQAKRRPHQPLRPRCEREDAKNEHEWVERREHPWLDSIRAQERPFEDDLEPTPRDVTPKEPSPEEPAPPQTVFESIQSRWRNGFWGGSEGRRGVVVDADEACSVGRELNRGL
ncbi:hypothetical protein BGZ61DRAFT_169569 [Ilyonectria robusta]|uniref:uncharacterized protein n=1 Tax=Ilyonectria robusta TaxID=1079257 RepID=UPI001E8CFA52|nr:uncharacterized protein BGZ61DRAFT_169569 [Ilyonectria robusta]KAH8734029.1 hypothetical protein BGZ61DRAFT_169569 [Ilyonectria robusta]